MRRSTSESGVLSKSECERTWRWWRQQSRISTNVTARPAETTAAGKVAWNAQCVVVMRLDGTPGPDRGLPVQLTGTQQALVCMCSRRAHSSAAGAGCGAAAQAGRPPQPHGPAAAHARPALRGARESQRRAPPLCEPTSWQTHAHRPQLLFVHCVSRAHSSMLMPSCLWPRPACTRGLGMTVIPLV